MLPSKANKRPTRQRFGRLRDQPSRRPTAGRADDDGCVELGRAGVRAGAGVPSCDEAAAIRRHPTRRGFRPMTTDQHAPDQALASGPTITQMMIGGESADAAEGKTFDVVNPATGKVIATAPLGGR